MQRLLLIKPGEIELKLGNRREFVRRLKDQIHQRLGSIPHLLEEYPGRFFLKCEPRHEAVARFVLEHCPGVNGIAHAFVVDKTPEAIAAAAVEAAREEAARGARTFKAETRRSDKSFPLDSYGMSATAGEAVSAAIPELSVDVHQPDFVLTLEIRERAYVYASTVPGPRGLPVGTQGKGLLLLSGGIDSPVAGYLMAKRGLALEAVYFHAYPYTSEEARHKVEKLACRIAAWTGGMQLWVVPFTDVQLAIKKGGREEANTTILRMAMMQAADMLAQKTGAIAMVTGESLGQVASQTAQNMRLSQSTTTLPVLRPLIGIDKEDTILMAKRIGTYDISILPYEDCCVLFSPRHPVLKPDFEDLSQYYRSLCLDTAIADAVQQADQVRFGYREVMQEFGVALEG